VEYLGVKELQRVNKCITSQITDFEQATLAQISDKWKPITLAGGVFDLDELKRDISTSDAKFSVRKYKPTALILEYLTSRSTTQQVPLPALMLQKSTAGKKKRASDAQADNHTKRFRKGRQRPLFLLDQDAEENDEQDDQQDEDEQDAQDPDAVDDSNWESYPFEPRKSFSPCTTPYCKDKNIAHTHSTDRCYKLHPQSGKGGKGIKGSNSLLFTKGGKGNPKRKGKGKPGKGKGNRKGKRPKGKDTRGLGRSLDDTCHFCKQPGHYKAECPKFAALSSKTSYGRIRAKLSNEKVYVYDLLEDSVDSEVCWNCLCQECDWATCATPVESLLFHDASKSFVEDGMWDLVSSAKTSNPPLTKEVFLQERGPPDDHWEGERENRRIDRQTHAYA
jgi:hypothetical protein